MRKKQVTKNPQQDSSVPPIAANKADTIGFFQLYRYADTRDRISILFGTLFAVLSGTGFPLNFLIFRDVINNFVSQDISIDFIYGKVVWFAVIGAAVFISTVIQSLLLGISANRQARRIRLLYFKSLLRQNVSWFDGESAGSLINKLSQNVDIIEYGIGTKFGEFVQNIVGFLAGLSVAFSVGWKLSLVASAALPLVVIVFGLLGFLIKRFTLKELEAYSQAGAIANEVLLAIRTVLTFGGEKKELSRYTTELTKAESVGIRKSTVLGGVVGSIGLTLFSTAALVFWYGVQLILTESYDGGAVIAVFVTVVIGGILLGNALPSFQYFITAMASAKDVYATIEREPPINIERSGTILPEIEGTIRFEGINFSYPMRPSVKVLENFNLEIQPGQMVALVGPSGSGKSTIVHMLQRFYDPLEGKIVVDGVDLRELDVTAFRSQMGCVQQEPVLFGGTIAENIRMGKLDAGQDEIEEAARLANAHDFILSFPEGYDTLIGERGAGMSGGQKQRIAIARALLRKPKLMLLDEATSALDTQSERVVQAALDKAVKGRTVIVVAHRLTTVRNADRIVVLDGGRIRESGTHDELVAKGGLYAAMLSNQEQQQDIAPDEETPIDDGYEKKEKSRLSRDSSKLKQFRSSFLDDQLDSQYEGRSAVMRMLHLNRPELKYIIPGCFCSVISGAAQPAFAIAYSEMFKVFSLQNQPDQMQMRVLMIAGIMVGIGVARFLGQFGQGYFFGVSGERLTRRARALLFKAILSQEPAWFDEQENQPGALTVRLAREASYLKSLSGEQLGFILEAAVLVMISLGVAFAYSWQLSLLMMCFAPPIILSGMLQVKRMSGKQNDAIDSNSMRTAQESIAAHRTVFTFSLERYFYEQFENSLADQLKSALRSSVLYGILYAFTQSTVIFAFSANFALGAYLTDLGVIEMIAVFRVFAVLNMGAQSLGRTASYGPEFVKAKVAVKSIFETLDRKPKIPVDVGDVPEEEFSGKIEFKNVSFKYPNRSGVYAVKNFSHTVEAGQTVALVGQSGCGKSTLLQLVQRFYDPSLQGTESGVFFDGLNLRYLQPTWVRRQIGVVSQEPNLFDISIQDNIAYGDNTRDVPMEDIIEAARMANIHQFIETLPQGYETFVGASGSQLSGGQKQRVAIARALLRKPKLLVLDEATSALDNESERVVQEALDGIVGSSTSLVVAHRLTTVENADLIVVLQDGQKIEVGSPSELLEAKGAFYRLHHTDQMGQE